MIPPHRRFSPWTEQLAKDIVLRYWSQGGTDQSRLEPYMTESYEAVYETIEADCDALWTKARKAAGNAPQEWRKREGR